ncbi:MAG: hypothetical protein HFH93_04230 [Lachnospiraceae bacterium]|nr:hypothetical protein [Lachnospiraceae bacterium]
MSAIGTVTEKQEQLHGMALGGIGTGSVEIRQNGSLEDWEIFNLGLWASSDPKKYHKEDLPEYDQDVLPFYVRTKQEGREPVVRKLSHGKKIGGFRSVMYSFLKNVETIRWTPDFPICHMEYEDPGLPVELKAEFMSPFVPHDAKTSGMPGFYVNFRVKNKTMDTVEVSLMGTLKNPVNRGLADRKLKNTVKSTGGRTTLLMESTSDRKAEQNGSMALSVVGGNPSYIKGDYGEFFGAYVLGGAFGSSEESCLFDFRDLGELPNLGWEEADEELCIADMEAFKDVSETKINKMLESVKKLASGYRPWKRLTQVRPDILETAEGKREFLGILLRQYRSLEEMPCGGFGDGALCSKVVLAPGESREVTFLVNWHFPHHVSPENCYVGHRYTCWCQNAEDAAAYLADNGEEIRRRVRMFSEALQNCSAPAEFTRNWVIQLSTLVKCSWWAENGDFGIWEGLGSCGFHTMDISYYGSYMILALFPELQLRQMEMGIRFQREDGRVHHFFRPDFEHVDQGYDRVDMNPQFVLMVCRDYMWTGDREYLKRMWEPVVKAMASTEKLDGDGDGLPDHDTRANTYDAWRFRGIPSYIAGLWLAALTAAVNLAEEMREEKLADHWREILAKGKESFKKLWNGEYFSLWVDGEERDECLMSGQLDAAWYCKVMGIPGYVEDEYISKVLNQVWKHNYTEESGLINASYPEGKKPTLYTYGNVQVESNWSGIELALSGMYLEMGEFERARAIAANVDRRYVQAGRIFNHEECGGHYYRPLAAWTLMLSLSGFRYEREKAAVTIAPKQETLTAPWFTPYGYGVLKVTKDRVELSVLDGNIEVKKLQVWQSCRPERLTAGGVETAFEREENSIRPAESITLNSGEALVLCLSTAGAGGL